MKKILTVFLSAVMVLSMTSCADKNEQTEEAKPTPAASAAAVVTEHSAPMTANSETKVYSDGRGEIIECGAEEGDTVQAGQLLYRIDDNGLFDTIATTKNSIEKANITIATAEENEAGLKIYAPASGIIKGLTVKEGERVNTGTIAKITDDSEFVARIPFNSAQIADIRTGMSAEVISDEMMSGTPASVTRIYSERNTSIPGTVLYDVELRGKNPGTLSEGMSVTAVINGIASPAAGYIDESEGVSVVSRQSGKQGSAHNDNRKFKCNFNGTARQDR